MKLFSSIRVIFFFCIAVTVFSCNSEKEDFVSEPLSNYLPLVVGKYITYRLDSTVITNFNKIVETHRYQLKEQVDALITDNLGRPSYRVYTYLRDSLGTTPWVPSGTYMVTAVGDQIEVLESNFRFIKMHMPVKKNFEWRGNAFLPNKPYQPVYGFNNDDGIQDWSFYYESIGESFTYAGRTYTDVLTVEEEDDGVNFPVTDPAGFGFKTRAVEKYSKGIGQVFREYTMTEWQPLISNRPNTYWGFGIKKWMIDHN